MYDKVQLYYKTYLLQLHQKSVQINQNFMRGIQILHKNVLNQTKYELRNELPLQIFNWAEIVVIRCNAKIHPQIANLFEHQKYSFRKNLDCFYMVDFWIQRSACSVPQPSLEPLLLYIHIQYLYVQLQNIVIRNNVR